MSRMNFVGFIRRRMLVHCEQVLTLRELCVRADLRAVGIKKDFRASFALSVIEIQLVRCCICSDSLSLLMLRFWMMLVLLTTVRGTEPIPRVCDPHCPAEVGHFLLK